MQDEPVAPPRHDSAPSSPTTGAPGDAISPGGSLRAALRLLGPLVGAEAVQTAGTAAPLERFTLTGDPPAVASCVPLESTGPREIVTDSAPVVAAFLDGVQRSRVVGHLADSPLIFATVAAAVQQRAERRLATWGTPAVRSLVLASRAHLGEEHWEALEATGLALVDVSDPGRTDLPLHPLAVRTRALEFVAAERETLERRLAADWCRTESGWLWVDGGISGNLAVDAAAPAFGVVKSHTTLYGDASAVRAALRLVPGTRSPLFLVQHRARRGVASWYLRLHAGRGGDPLHGLVRVEVAPPSTLYRAGEFPGSHRGEWHPDESSAQAPRPDQDALDDLSRRADAISAWMLAERAPLALPDPRWDTLTYGVYACEQYLKALIGA